MLIDMHCHLDLYQDMEAVIRGASENDIFILSVCTAPSAYPGSRSRIQGGRIRVSPGLHPELIAQRHGELPLLLEQVKQSRYVGEIGMDGSPGHTDWIDKQAEAFAQIIQAGCDAGVKAYSIHSRRASGRVLDVLEAHKGRGEFILHWFSGTSRDLKRAIALGCWFSIGPAMSRSSKGKALCQEIPLTQILTETDGPFVIIDGRPAIPTDVRLVIEDLSKLFSMSTQTIETTIYENFKRLISRLPNQ